MENKLLSRILFGVRVVIIAVAAYFFYGMLTNGKPSDFDPAQIGVELIDEGKATNANYIEKGQEVADQKVRKLEGNITTGISFMQWVLYIAGGLLGLFLLYGVVLNATMDFKRALPSILFVLVAAIALIIGMTMQSPSESDTAILGASEEVITQTNFWVYALMAVLIPGVILLVLDLVWGIARSFTK